MDPIRVLVVDDEEAVGALVVEALADRGIEAEATQSARDALERVRARQHEVAIVDLVMPEMSASWKASVPIRVRPTCPVMATTGMESIWASASGVTRLVAPGPEVAIMTPTLPVACA